MCGRTMGRCRDLAAMGVARWEDITNEKGRILNNVELQACFGRGGTDRCRKLLHNVRAHAQRLRDAQHPAWQAWLQQCARERAHEVRPQEPRPDVHMGCDVLRWRVAPLYMGGKQYLLRWSTGARTWESHRALVTDGGGSERLRKEAMSVGGNAEAREAHSWAAVRGQRWATGRPDRAQLEAYAGWLERIGRGVAGKVVAPAPRKRAHVGVQDAPTLYGPEEAGERRSPKARMVPNLHRSARAHGNAARAAGRRQRVPATQRFAGSPVGVREREPLPPVSRGHAETLRRAVGDRYAISEGEGAEERMRDVVLRLVARVSEMEYDAVDGPAGRMRLDKEERKALNSN